MKGFQQEIETSQGRDLKWVEELGPVLRGNVIKESSSVSLVNTQSPFSIGGKSSNTCKINKNKERKK